MPFRFPKDDTVRQFCRANPRFHPDAYYLVQHAVSVAHKFLGPQPPSRHISGQELARTIRQVLLELYGPLAIDVLNHWNVHATADFGRLVYDLSELKLLSASEDDDIHDFDDVYDFQEAFVKPFSPEERPTA